MLIVTIRLLIIAVGAMLLGVSVATATSAPPADLILLHGKVHTQDAARRIVEAVAIRGNTIVAVGADEHIKTLAGPSTASIDLGGRIVLPGIIDAHTHPAESAQDRGKCNLRDQPLTTDRLKTAVSACLKTHPGDATLWFEVVQVNPSELALSRADLDSILATRPLILEGSDGHTAWVNSAALRAAHITSRTPDPSGGRIERDAHGNPTGTLRDDAYYLAWNARPTAGISAETALLHQALTEMRAAGITSVQDASVDDHDMQLYRRLYTAHRLNMRVRASFLLKDLYRPADILIREARAFRAKWSVDAEYLRADAVKIFADGVIEYPSQTAALLEPYLDGNGHSTVNRGPDYFTQANLNRIVEAADAAGFTVHVHAIGDRAVRASLDAFAYSRQQHPDNDHRHQIAHLELIDPADFARFRDLGVIANMQLLWAERGDYIDAATIPFIGPTRAQHLYAARSLLDAGAVIAAGSDWGVSSFNPFEAMEHAITRAGARDEQPLLPEQSIPLQAVVDAYTINAAYALKQDRTTGSLEPGKRGDFIILDRDIFAIDPFDLHATRVLATYLDGRQVYAADDWLK